MTDKSPSITTDRDNLFVAVGSTVSRLQSQYLGEQGDRAQAQARGVLAELRRRAGQTIEQDPLALEHTLLVLEPTLKGYEVGKSDYATLSEAAAFHALALFALHMQSATQPMHVQRVSFASACGKMYAHSESGSLKPRFDALLLARSAQSRLSHTRSMITLLRGENLGFDYAQFANDLRSLEKPDKRSGVLLRWGRDFALGQFHANNSTDDKTNTQTS